MKKIIIFTSLVLLGGCSFVAPKVSKAMTEKEQLNELKRQNDILERIAVALEK